MARILLVLFLSCSALWAADEMTVYDLLAPATHSFDIVYDVSATTPGAPYFFNPIRPGSTASKERVVDRASGKPLTFSIVDGKAAKAAGGVDTTTTDEAQYLRVTLLHPVPKGAETRIRIYKTYTDVASYKEAGSGLVFERPFGIKRNVVILPKGYELTGSASPAIVSTDPDGRTGELITNPSASAGLWAGLLKRNKGRLPYFEVLLKLGTLHGVAETPEVVAVRILPGTGAGS